MARAFLIARFDASSMPPKLASLAISSESWDTATLSHGKDRFYADLAEGQGWNFEAARAELFQTLKLNPGMHWAIEWLRERGEVIP